jgi:hypothetical protein
MWQTTAVAIVALACMAPSMAVNAVHQLNHTPGPMAWPLAGAAILSVLLAGSSPFAMGAALSQRRFGVFLAALAAFVVCASYNLASAVGAASTARSETIGARTADNSRLSLLMGQLSQAVASRSALAAASGEQTPGMVDAELTAMRNDARWARSKGCADATLPDSRTFCAEYAQLAGKRDAAVKVAELDRDMASLKAQLLTATSADAGQPADPQADNIARAVSVLWSADAGQIGTGLNLWFALTIEVLGSFGPSVFAILFRHQTPAKHAPGAPPVSLRRRAFLARRSGQGRRTKFPGSGQKADKADKKRTSGQEADKPAIPTDTKDEKLSKEERDRQITQMLSTGHTQADIADKLGVSARTVRRVLGGLPPSSDSQNVIAMRRPDLKD